MERMESIIPGMSESEYYAKAFQRSVWRALSLPEKVHCVIEMQQRAAALMRLRGKEVEVWQE